MKISDLHPDTRNANKGTKRGNQAIESSLRRFGAGRSILLDKHGVIIAGNKTAENAKAAGLDDVIVVQTDGTKLVAVQRTDLDLSDPKAIELAIADNRAGELSLEWDADILKELSGELNLQPFFTAEELAATLGIDTDGDPNMEPEIPESKYKEQYGVMVICPSEDNQREVYDQLIAEGFNCRVVCT
jgi:hypothetical protein